MAQSSTILALCMMGLLAVVNAAAFVLFMRDKHLASEGMRRIPESTLLLVALIGGSAGAIAGQQYWRHKTRKEPFRTMLFGIAIVHVTFLAWLIYDSVGYAAPARRADWRGAIAHLNRDAARLPKVPGLRFPGTTPGGAAPRPTTPAVHTESSAAA
jgi:uncharacterized membrane protein YsdA (DUF1294 family)